MTTNPNKIGTLSASAVTEIEDGTDSIHTGLIKVLNQQAIGSFISKGFNVNQASTQFQINSSTNEWFDRGEFKSNNTFSAITDNLASGTFDYYSFLVVVKDSTTLALRSPASAGTGKIRVANLTEGDIPICLIKVSSGSGVNAGSRPIQYYGTQKLDSKFAAINNSAETMKITKEGTFVKASNTGTISLPSVGSTNSTLLSTNDKGISNGNILEANANVADNDFLRVDGTKIEGRTVAELKSDLGLAKADVGLENVDNTADSLKPISTDAQTALDLKATINNPTFTGTIGIPNIANIESAITANTAKTVRTDSEINTLAQAKVDTLVASAPDALNTLNELAAALGDDASFSTTTATALGNRLRIDINNQNLTSTQLTNVKTNLTLAKADVGLGSVLNQPQIKTFKQDGIPTSTAIGDQWYDTNDNNKLYIAESVGATSVTSSGGGGWVLISLTKTTVGLSNLDSLESGTGTKLAGIEAGATDGASSSQVTAINANTNKISYTDATAVSANTAKVSFALPTTDIDTAQTTTIGSDFLIIYDDDVGALRKVKAKNLLHKITANELISGGSGTGGVFTTLPASGATVGGTLGSGGNILLEDGSTKATDATILNSNTTKSDVGLGSVENITTTAMREGVTAANVGLGNVTNVSQSTIQAATLLAASKTDVDLGNVDNTTDAAKQTAILSAATKSDVGLSNVLNEVQTTVFKQDDAPSARVAGDLWVDTNDSNKLYRATGTGTGNWEEVTVAKAALGLAKADVGLGDVDNDSTATIRAGTTAANVGLGNVTNVSQATIQAATLTAADKTDVGLANVDNDSTATIRAGTTKANVGLGSVDNTADTAKPVSTAQQTALDAKVPTTRTIAGKALSSNLTLGIDASGKLEINDGGTGIKIKNPSSADVIFDNTKTEYDEIQDANNTKPADNATVGARLGTNLKAADGSTTLGDDDVKNASITLTKSVSGNTKTLSLTNANAATTTLEFEDGATKTQTFRSDDPPTAVSIGDLWVDTNDGNKVYSASATGTGGWNLVTASYTDTEKTKLSGIAANATASSGDVTLTGTETLTNKTLTSPVINVGSDASGDLYYRAANGTYARLAKGTDGQVLKLASGLPSWAASQSGADGMGSGFTVSATTDTTATTITAGDDLFFAAGSGITAETTADGTVTITNTGLPANNAKTGITSTQASNITTNNAKVGITTTQANNITANNAKVTNTDTDVSVANLITKLGDISSAVSIGDASDVVVTIPGSLVVTGTTTTNNVQTVSTSNGVVFEGTAANDNELTLRAGVVGSDYEVLLPTAAGTLARTADVAYSSAISEGNSGLVPSAGNSGEFLKHDGTFGTPTYTTNTNTQNSASTIRTLIGSGNNGHVPTEGTAGHFLRHDGTFGIPSYTTNTDTNTQLSDSQVRSKISASGNSSYDSSTGVITSTDTNTQNTAAQIRTKVGTGNSGVVPAEGTAGDFLKHDGTFGTPSYIANTDTVYTHPTTAGNKHIPAGGASGQFLKYDSSGTAVWATPSYTTNTDTNTFRTIELDTDGNGTANNTLETTETLRLKKGSNITLTETGGVVTISSTDTNTDTNTQLDDAGVTSKVLTGLSVSATTSDVTASNTILEAIGHMEKRIRLNDDKVTNTDTDTNTTYDLLVPASTTAIRLDPSSGSNDDITITGGTNVTVTRTSATELTLSSTDTNTVYTHTTNANLTGDVTSVGNATTIAAGVIVNADVNASAAIAYSKLNLTGAVLNADLAGSIANAKLSNSAITIDGTSTSLGGSITTNDTTYGSFAGSTSTAGLVPVRDSGSTTTKYLREDGDWVVPPDTTIANTDVDVSVANLKTRLASFTSADTVYIGDEDDDTTIVIRGTLQVDGTTTTVNSTTVNLDDHNIVLDSGNSTSAVVDGAGFTLEGGSGDDVTFQWLASGTKMELKKDTAYANFKAGTIEGAFTGALTGNADTATKIDSIANNAIVVTSGNQTIAGTKTFSSAIAGSITGSSASTTGNAATVTNGVYTSGNQTIAGTKTFSSSISGNITGSSGSTTGNAATATKIADITNSDIVQLDVEQTLTLKTLTSPTLTTPALGTPSALVLTNATALPAAQVSQGTMASGMVLVAPVLGTPASGTLTNATGYTTANLSGTITNAQLAGSIANDKLAGSISGTKLLDDAITTAKIADDQITTATIADDAITTATIADDQITTATIADSAITGDKVSAFTSAYGQLTATLASNLSDNGHVALTSGTSGNLPTRGLIQIENELIYYTGISAHQTTGTVRGYAGTTAAAHTTANVGANGVKTPVGVKTTLGGSKDVFIPRFEGAGASSEGKPGLVPVSYAGKTATYLRGDGAWADAGTVANGNTGLVDGDAVYDYIAAQNFGSGSGDITAVVAGTGLSGGATSGSATLNIDSTVATLTGTQTLTNKTLTSPSIGTGFTFDGITLTTAQTSAESFADNDTSLMTSAAINDRIESFSYTTSTGDATLAGTQTFSGAKTFSATTTHTGAIDISSLYGRINFKKDSNGNVNNDAIYFINGSDQYAGAVKYFHSGNSLRFMANQADQLYITDGAIYAPVDNDVDLGTASLKFKNSYFGLVDAENFKVNGGQGSDGQILTSTGSGVAWENAASGGASAIGALDDVLMDATNFLDSILIQADSDGSAPTTGTLNDAKWNTGYGASVFKHLTDGTRNTGIGYHSLEELTGGTSNTAVGFESLGAITTSNYNVAIGFQAGAGAWSGADSNIAIGYQALNGSLTADKIIAIGRQAGQAHTSGTDSIYMGTFCALNVTTGSRNLVIGYEAYDGATTESDNIAIGHSALGGAVNGAEKTIAIGNYTLDALTSGDNNVAIGYSAGSALTTQASNTMVGFEAGTSSTSVESTYIGYYAGRNNLSNYNVAIGAEAMITYGDKTAERNTAIGNAALKVIQTGDKNTSVGGYSGLAVTTGSDNIFLGYSSGDNITTGDNNVVIGAADVTATGDDQLSISSGDGGVSWITGNSSGGINSKAEVVAVTGNTTLTLAQTGAYIYWTAGTLTLPASGTVGTQYTVINNKGSSASVALNGSNCAMISGFTNAAIADHELASFVCVTANNWIIVG